MTRKWETGDRSLKTGGWKPETLGSWTGLGR